MTKTNLKKNGARPDPHEMEAWFPTGILSLVKTGWGKLSLVGGFLLLPLVLVGGELHQTESTIARRVEILGPTPCETRNHK